MVVTDDEELMGNVPLLGTPKTVAALRTPQASSVMLCLVVLSPESWTAGQPGGCQGPDFEQSCFSAKAVRGSVLKTAVTQPDTGTDTTENLGVVRDKYLNPCVRVQLPVGWSCTLWKAQTWTQLKLRALPPPTQNPASVAGSTSISQPTSWANLFYDSKLSSSSSVASVETKYPLLPHFPWSLKNRLKSRKGFFQFQRIL